jgi:hypothetical protein
MVEVRDDKKKVTDEYPSPSPNTFSLAGWMNSFDSVGSFPAQVASYNQA